MGYNGINATYKQVDISRTNNNAMCEIFLDFNKIVSAYCFDQKSI